MENVDEDEITSREEEYKSLSIEEVGQLTDLLKSNDIASVLVGIDILVSRDYSKEEYFYLLANEVLRLLDEINEFSNYTFDLVSQGIHYGEETNMRSMTDIRGAIYDEDYRRRYGTTNPFEAL